MNITVPLRARKSNSSWVPWQARPSRRRALARLTRTPGNGRYFLSISLFVFMTGALIMSVVGGAIQNAAAERDYRNGRGNAEWAYYQRTARDNTPNNRSNQSPQNRSNQNTQQRTQKPESNKKEVAQAPATTKQQPLATKEKASPVVATPVRQAPRSAEPAAPVVKDAKPKVDTAPAIAKMTAAKADTMATPVTYTSQRISETTRDNLIMTSGVAMVVSFIMFAISLIGSGPKMTSAALFGAQRYQIPVKEIATN